MNIIFIFIDFKIELKIVLKNNHKQKFNILSCCPYIYFTNWQTTFSILATSILLWHTYLVILFRFSKKTIRNYEISDVVS